MKELEIELSICRNEILRLKKYIEKVERERTSEYINDLKMELALLKYEKSKLDLEKELFKK